MKKRSTDPALVPARPHLLPATLALAALLSGCSPSPPTENRTERTFAIAQARFLGSLWNESHARASIVSQDGGESFPVPGGAVWAFGDTFKGSRAPDGTPHFEGGAVSCTTAFLGKHARNYPPAFEYLVSGDGVAVSPFTYLPGETSERNRIWPLGGIHLNGRFYLFYSLIEVFGKGSWDFRSVGGGLGRSTQPLGPYERLQPHENWRFPVSPCQVLEAGGWIYLYEITKFEGQQGTALARVRPARMEDPEAYEFFSGPGPRFTPGRESAAPLLEHTPGQVSVAWNPFLGKYVLASSSDFLRPREIRFHVAEAPHGPWSPPVARVEMPLQRQGKTVNLVYCTYLHPELFRENGRVMVLSCSLGLKDSIFDANCEMVEIELLRQDPPPPPQRAADPGP